MANEITLFLQISVYNDIFADLVGPRSWLVTQAAIGGGGPGVVMVTTSEGDVSIPNISTLGYCFLKNILGDEDSGYVTYGPTAAGVMVPFGRLLPTEGALLRLAPGISMRAVASSGTVRFLVVVYEN